MLVVKNLSCSSCRKSILRGARLSLGRSFGVSGAPFGNQHAQKIIPVMAGQIFPGRKGRISQQRPDFLAILDRSVHRVKKKAIMKQFRVWIECRVMARLFFQLRQGFATGSGTNHHDSFFVPSPFYFLPEVDGESGVVRLYLSLSSHAFTMMFQARKVNCRARRPPINDPSAHHRGQPFGRGRGFRVIE